jgi:uncharacterized protein with PIN domain
MPTAFIYFHAELNDFFQNESSDVPIKVEFNGHETVKHVIEVLGVPHTEVGVILINGESVGFGQKPHNDDRIHVYPSMDGVDVSPVIWLKPEPLKEIRFVLDGHLGKLANYLRLLGFDSRYQNDFEDSELAAISSQEDRILLTRDRGLLKRTVVSYGYFVREKSPRRQLVEVVERFELAAKAKPFYRCANCNGVLQHIKKEEILDRLAPKTKLYYHEFRICDDCNQIYWKGSHFEKMESFFNGVLRGKRSSPSYRNTD